MLLGLLFAFLSLGILGAPQHIAAEPAANPHPTRVLDRVVARVEDDILFQSELDELGEFQLLQGSAKERDTQLLDRLINQWIVYSEANAARFPEPTAADVAQALAVLQSRFGSPQALESHLQSSGLAEAQLRRLLKQQIFLTRYIDYKFRTAIQVSPASIENYYRETLAPELSARQERLPPLADVEEKIRELLVQHEINLRADKWLEESRAQLRIVKSPNLQNVSLEKSNLEKQDLEKQDLEKQDSGKPNLKKINPGNPNSK